jgi:hypothetical protein
LDLKVSVYRDLLGLTPKAYQKVSSCGVSQRLSPQAVGKVSFYGDVCMSSCLER